MLCENCGNSEAYVYRKTKDGECCDSCGDLRIPWNPSVYFRQPYVDPNLGDYRHPHEANGVLITSKRHKARLMREQGVVEAGDRVRGGRNFDKSLARSAREQGHNPDNVPA